MVNENTLKSFIRILGDLPKNKKNEILKIATAINSWKISGEFLNLAFIEVELQLKHLKCLKN